MGDARTPPLDRRRFLQGIGSLAGAALLPLPWAQQAWGAVSAPSGSAIRIGVLLPDSQRHPQMARELLGGMESHFAERANTVAGRPVVLTPIPYGVSQAAALSAAGGLIAAGKVDIVAGMVNRDLAANLAPVLSEHDIPLVVSDIGADIVRKGREHPLIVRNSLGYWQANWAMGEWTARHLGKKAVIAADFHESGYDILRAFQLGFEMAGGTVLSTHIGNLPNGGGSQRELFALVEKVRPDFVYALYSGRPAAAFLDFYRSSGLDRIAPLAAGGFLVEGAFSTDAASAADGILSVMSWAGNLLSTERTGLADACQRHCGITPGPFAALGFETAQRISHGVEALNGETGNGARLAQALATAIFESPRGRVAMDPATGETVAPVYLRRTMVKGNSLAHASLTQLSGPDSTLPAFAELRSSLKTGWLNAYLVA